MNPTEVEVHDIINRHDNGTGVITFDDFCKESLESEKDNVEVLFCMPSTLERDANFIYFDYYANAFVFSFIWSALHWSSTKLKLKQKCIVVLHGLWLTK